jgi:hypothetical protein
MKASERTHVPECMLSCLAAHMGLCSAIMNADFIDMMNFCQSNQQRPCASVGSLVAGTRFVGTTGRINFQVFKAALKSI